MIMILTKLIKFRDQDRQFLGVAKCTGQTDI